MGSVKHLKAIFFRLFALHDLDHGDEFGKPVKMFPIRDHNPSEQTPYVTYAFIAINIVVFLATLPISEDAYSLAQFYSSWAMTPAQISNGDQYYTLITSMFLHGGLMHIGGNMLFLWIFGDNLEDELGHIGFAFFYILCGVLAGAAHWLADPSSMVPTVGASGAIAGVMGGYLVLYPRAKVDVLVIFVIFFKIFPLPAWVMLGLWFALQLFSGVTTDVSGGGVAYWAHAGGFIVGFLYLLPVLKRNGGTAFWQRNQGHPPHPPTQYNDSRIPRIVKRK